MTKTEILKQIDKPEKDVSVLMLSWQDAHLLYEWFDNFLKYTQTSIKTEVIVIDNGSGDPKFDLVIKKYAGQDNFYFLKNPTNEYIPAINKLAPMAGGRYIMLAAPGAPFLNDVIGPMKMYLDSHPNVGAVSAKFINEDDSFQNVYKKFLSIPRIFLEGTVEMGRKLGVTLAKNFNIFHSVPEGTDPMKPFPIERAHLCAFMLRREAVGNEPIIEPTIPLGPCDADLCKRIYKKGHTVRGLPEARVLHHRSVALNHHRENFKNQCNILGTLRYFQKHHSFQYPLLKSLFLIDQSISFLRLWLQIKFLKKRGIETDANKLAYHRHLLSLLARSKISVLG